MEIKTINDIEVLFFNNKPIACSYMGLYFRTHEYLSFHKACILDVFKVGHVAQYVDQDFLNELATEA